MTPTNPSALETLHRLLHNALVEIRYEGHEEKNKVVYHLANLFHVVVLDMAAAAEGRTTYEAVLKTLEEKARESGCEKWLTAARAALQAAAPPAVPATPTPDAGPTLTGK